jgi:hypothetical protein
MAWFSQMSEDGGLVRVNPEVSPADQARQMALIRYYRENNLEAARAAWSQQSQPPADLNEIAMVADIQASAADPAALDTIARLRQSQPAEADVMLAELRFVQRDYEGAAAALESAFSAWRRDAWPLPRFAHKGISRAQVLGAASPAIARRMFEALKEPLAVKVADHRRRSALAVLSTNADFKGLCAQAVGALEPNVPWAVEFLTLRRNCYAETGDQRLSAATRDLNEFLSMTGLPLDSGLAIRSAALR